MKFKFSEIKRKKILIILSFIAVILFVVVSSLIRLNCQNNVKTAIKLAGKNKTELIAVLNHYSKVDKDEQKLEAAKFLISNCYIHSSARIEIYDLNNNRIYFNPIDYPSDQSVKEVKDSLFKTSIIKQKISNDVEELSSEYLIKYIDFSFNVWKESPWYDQVNFDQFCKYILPYRAVNEPVSEWIELLHSKYKHIIDTLSDISILNACKAVNKVLANDIHYENRWVTGGLGTMSVAEMLENKNGMCDDLVVFGTCVMRSLGIPVAVDFDIHGRFNYGHSWCVVFDQDGHPWSFGPGEEQPGEHINTFEKYRWRKLAKVFRRNFQINSEGVGNNMKNQKTIPPFFSLRDIIDVTDEYINTVDFEINLDEKLNEKIIYLCVYNNKTWIPLQFSKIENNKIKFPQMGTGILYCPGYYKNDRIHLISLPFILEEDGSKKEINGDGELNNQRFFMTKIYGYEYAKKDKIYNLYKWEGDKWKYIKDFVSVKDSLLEFQGLNENTLYRFQESSRPFTVSDSLSAW